MVLHDLRWCHGSQPTYVYVQPQLETNWDMTFYHFLNCALLAYGPMYVSYYGLGLAEERQWFVCFRAGFLYLFSQIVKMILIATFIPISSSDSFHAITEVKRVFISLIDVAVVGFMLYSTKGNRKIRDLAVAIGWSCADSIFGCFLPLFSYAVAMNSTGATYKYALELTYTLLQVLVLLA